jgi:hypothetical protein
LREYKVYFSNKEEFKALISPKKIKAVAYLSINLKILLYNRIGNLIRDSNIYLDNII